MGTGGLSSWMETRRGDREAMSVLSFQMNKPGSLCWVLTPPSHTFSFSVHLTNITAHQSLIFLSELLETKNLKSFFSKHTAFRHSWLNIWNWVDIRLIASPQHAPSVTSFSWDNVGSRLPWESLFRNLISNYSLSMIGSKKKLYVYTFLEKVMRSA